MIDESEPVMPEDRLILSSALDFEARRAFIATARQAINSADAEVELDCLGVDSVDDTDIGMLVVLARAAQRRAVRVVLVSPSEPLRRQLDSANLSHFFDQRH